MSKEVLIVDDDKLTIKYTQVYFEHEGYKVDYATSASEARMKLGRNVYDVLITDIMMPIETGRELAIYSNKHYPDMPVILCSAYFPHEEEKRQYLKATGAKAFIDKPLLPFKVEEALQDNKNMVKLKYA